MKMCVLSSFLDNLHRFLTGIPKCSSLIRKHTKKLELLGDLSFPLNIKSWYQVLNLNQLPLDENAQQKQTIFDYLHPNVTLEDNLTFLKMESEKWQLHITQCIIIADNVHVFISRKEALLKTIPEVLKQAEKYGIHGDNIFGNKMVFVEADKNIDACDLSATSLSDLRLSILKNVVENLINCFQNGDSHDTKDSEAIILTLKSNVPNAIMCGAVLNQNGVKDCETTAQDLYKKRSTDMQLIAQHKYGLRLKSVKSSLLTQNYFENLGKTAVVIEMLQNKPHKPIKVGLHDLQMANKGPSFICYNCARISALFQEFYSRVESETYPQLPPVEKINVELLQEPEEWEIFFVYILQFPHLVKSCIYDILNRTVNPHNLTVFLVNLSSIFSVYYRRVKILTNSRECLINTLHARMYFLKCVQYVFHNTFSLLGVEPIDKM